FACVSNAMIYVPVYHTFDSESIKFLLIQTGLRIVFCDNEQRLKFLFELCQKLKNQENDDGKIQVEKFVLMKRNAILSDQTKMMFENAIDFRVMTFDELMKLGREKPKSFQHPAPDDVYIICYTSGTTGNPKGVVLTHRNMVAGV